MTSRPEDPFLGPVAPFWVDDLGRRWTTSFAEGKLKPRNVPLHAALRRFVMVRDNGTCLRCGVRGIIPLAYDGRDPIPLAPPHWCLIADHIVPQRNGGASHPDNLQTLCNKCNSHKGSRSVRYAR